MATKLKILWVHDEFHGPINGLAEYNNGKVWFRRHNWFPEVPIDKINEQDLKDVLLSETNKIVNETNKIVSKPSKVIIENKSVSLSTKKLMEEDSSDSSWDSEDDNVNVADTDLPLETKKFDIYRLDPEILKIIEEDHIAYCEQSGYSLYYGEPLLLKAPKIIKKFDGELKASEGKDYILADHRLMMDSKKYHFKINPNEIYGDKVLEVNEEAFINYYQPHLLSNNS